MNLDEFKKAWSFYNRVLLFWGRCINCKKKFNGRSNIFFCTSYKYNYCGNCQKLINPSNHAVRNTTLENLVQIRLSMTMDNGRKMELMADTDNNKVPWENDLECIVCFEEYNKEIFMCKLGHNICCSCYLGIINTNNVKCPVCRNAYDVNAPLRNLLLEKIMHTFQYTKIHNGKMPSENPIQVPAGDYSFTRVDNLKCPIIDCTSKISVQFMNDHLQKQHAKNYVFLNTHSKDSSISEYSISESIILVANKPYSAGIHVKGLGLFGLQIDIRHNTQQLNKQYVGHAEIIYLSGIYEAFDYHIKLTCKKAPFGVLYIHGNCTSSEIINLPRPPLNNDLEKNLRLLINACTELKIDVSFTGI